MLARDIMTTKVVTSAADARVKDIARLLIENGISALPVVNTHGEVIGMVSEGDLIGRSEKKRLERRDWWLAMLAEGETLAPEFLTDVKSHGEKAYEIMSSPVVTVNETTEISEIAHLLTEHHIKRVPVVSDNRLVGIVSRADIVRAFAVAYGQTGADQRSGHGKSALSEAFASLDQRFHAHLHHQPEAKTDSPPVTPEAKLTVKDFQALVTQFEQSRASKQEDAQHKIAEQHKQQVNDLINRHLDDGNWQVMLHHAREAAQRGEKECMIMRFPNDLCSDGGRAINVEEHGWQETLRGEAAEFFLRWEKDLKPQGFHLSARTLEYPGGFPGDIGLFLGWGYKSNEQR